MSPSSARSKPEPCNLTKGQIEEIATKAAKVTGFVPGAEITPIVKKLGGEIEYLDWVGWLQHDHDTIEIDGPEKFTIRLMAVDGPLRHRFTIAHELGHYILHSLSGKKQITAGRKGSTRVEWEANWFAAAFLMPAKEFRTAMRELGSNALALAGRFLVSLEAAEVRIKTLQRA